MSYKNVSSQFFDISWSLWSSITWQKLAKSVFTKSRKVIFPMLEILRPDFRYFAKLPHSGVNMSGKGRDAPSNFYRR